MIKSLNFSARYDRMQLSAKDTKMHRAFCLPIESRCFVRPRSFDKNPANDKATAFCLNIMRDSKGRFVKGEHWRPKRPYWNREWLYNEYVIRGRSSSEIAADWSVTDNAICFWLEKLNIPTRSISEGRKLKHWGQSGKSNPMYNRHGEENPNWKGGATADRQAFYDKSL